MSTGPCFCLVLSLVFTVAVQSGGCSLGLPLFYGLLLVLFGPFGLIVALATGIANRSSDTKEQITCQGNNFVGIETIDSSSEASPLEIGY